MKKGVTSGAVFVIISVSALLIAYVSSVKAAMVDVFPGGNIQQTIDAADPGDVIIVHEGIYHERINFGGKAITVRGTNPGDMDIARATVIDGDMGGPVVTFVNGEENGSVLSGITMRHGNFQLGGGIHCNHSSPIISDCIIQDNTSEGGGGIFLGWSSSPTITNCIINGNSSGIGGGINCYDGCSPNITNCIISNNSASLGSGGIACADSSPFIAGCIISGNSTNERGGGFDCWDNSSPIITYCTITGNSAGIDGGGIHCCHSSITIMNCTIMENSSIDFGGGIYCLGASASIRNCTISDNSADLAGGGIFFNSSTTPTITNCIISGNSAGIAGGGISCDLLTTPIITNCTISRNSAGFAGGGISCDSPQTTITNCILWGDLPQEMNSPPIIITYSNIQGGYPGEGNTSYDPLFVNPAGGDFRLRHGSPCIDAGDPDTLLTQDREGTARPIDGDRNGLRRCDMGAYEYSPAPVSCPLSSQPGMILIFIAGALSVMWVTRKMRNKFTQNEVEEA